MKDWKELLNLENDEVIDEGMVNLQQNKMNTFQSVWFSIITATNTFIFGSDRSQDHCAHVCVYDIMLKGLKARILYRGCEN